MPLEPSDGPITELHERKSVPAAIKKLEGLRQSPTRDEVRAAHAQEDFAKRLKQKSGLLFREVIALLVQKNLTLNSGAITYNLILAFVPLLAIAFTFFQVFGGLDALMQAVIIPRIERYFDSAVGAILSAYLSGFVSNIRTGTLGATALLTLLLTVVTLLGAMERAFNEIREAPFERPVLSRLLNYWVLLTLTPFVIVVSAAKSSEALSYFGQFLSLDGAFLSGEGSATLRSLGAFLVETAGFAVLYWVLPARRVSPTAALVGGLLAAMGLESLQWVNNYATARLVHEASLVQLYGSVPLLLVILLIWLRLVALVLLLGMVVATAWHRVMSAKAARDPSIMAPRDHLLHVAEVFDVIVSAFAAGKKGPTRERLLDDLGLTRAETQRILDWLSSKDLIWPHKTRLHTRWSPSQNALELYENPEFFCTKALELPILRDPTKPPLSEQPATPFAEKIRRLITAP